MRGGARWWSGGGGAAARERNSTLLGSARQLQSLVRRHPTRRALRFPQLDGIAFGIVEAGKAAVGVRFRIDCDGDSGAAELRRHHVKMANAKVHHPRPLRFAEVAGSLARKNRPPMPITVSMDVLGVSACRLTDRAYPAGASRTHARMLNAIRARQGTNPPLPLERSPPAASSARWAATSYGCRTRT